MKNQSYTNNRGYFNPGPLFFTTGIGLLASSVFLSGQYIGQNYGRQTGPNNVPVIREFRPADINGDGLLDRVIVDTDGKIRIYVTEIDGSYFELKNPNDKERKTITDVVTQHLSNN